MSTAAQITVTAKVAERIVFCVYTTGDSDSCGENAGTGDDKSGTAITLGDNNGVLSPAGPFVSAYNATPTPDEGTRFSITTNASQGATVRLKGYTLATGPNGTGNTITPNVAANASSPGNEQFGLCVDPDGASGLSIDTVYDGDPTDNDFVECAATTNTAGSGNTGGAGTAEFAFDDTGTGTTSLYGDSLATKIAGDYSTGKISFIGNISNSTEAGIYTTILTFIATGVY
jgi:hypothetical protein